MFMLGVISMGIDVRAATLNAQYSDIHFSPDTVSLPNVITSSDSLQLDLSGHSFADLDRYFSGLAANDRLKLSGFITLGADIGLAQDLNTSQSSALRYWTQGELKTEMLGIPVIVSGQYFQQAIRPESQNFIRIAFNREALNTRANEITSSKLGLVHNQRDQLLGRLQDLDMQSSFMSTLEMYPDAVYEFDELKDDTLHPINPIERPDPEALTVPNLNSETMPQISEPITVGQYANQSVVYDSLRTDDFHNALELRRQQLQDSLKRLNAYEARLNKIDEESLISTNPQQGAKKWLDGIQAFQMGQVIPVFSSFIVAPQPVNGVFAKYESANRDIAVVHGQVIADMRPPQDTRSAWLQQITSEVIPVGTNIGDRITAGMISLWKREGNFLRFNVMSGIDKWNENPQDLRPSGYPIGRNAAAEIEGKVLIAQGHSVEAVYAYSASANTVQSGAKDEGRWNANSSANFAAKVRWNGEWTKAKVTAAVEGKLVGGQFRSIANPFLREDQGIYEARIRKLWKKGNVELIRKYRRNNISRIAPTTTSFSQWMVKYNHRIGKKWKVGLVIAPLHMSIENNEENTLNNMRGRQVMGSVNRVARIGRMIHFSQIVYTDIILNDQIAGIRNEMRELMVDYRISWENGWMVNSTTMSSTYLGVNSDDLSRLLRFGLNVSKEIGSSGSYEGGATWLVQEGTKPQPGYRAAISKRWKCGLEAAIILEKTVMENYFSEEILGIFRNNPYRSQAKLTLSF